MPVVICTMPALDIIEVVGIATGTSVDDVDIPSGTTTGDVTYVIAHAGGGSVDSSASGWTTLYNASSPVTRVFRRVWASPPSGQLDIGDASAGIWASITLRNVNQSTPEDVALTSANNALSGAPDAPSITTVTDKCLILAIGILEDDFVSLAGFPSGYSNDTLITRVDDSSGAIWLCTKQKGPAGAEDPSAFSGVGADDTGRGITIAVRPA